MTAVVWAAVPLLAVVAVDDLRHRRIRNRDVGALSVVTAVVVAAFAIDQGGDVVARAMLGATLAAVPLLVADHAHADLPRPAHRISPPLSIHP